MNSVNSIKQNVSKTALNLLQNTKTNTKVKPMSITLPMLKYQPIQLEGVPSELDFTSVEPMESLFKATLASCCV